jgi:hypothetical protein
MKSFHDLLDELNKGNAPSDIIEAFVRVRDTLVYARDMAKAELGKDVSPEVCVQLCDMILEQSEMIRESEQSEMISDSD